MTKIKIGRRKESNKIMSENIKIISVEKPEWGIIGGGIHNYNIQQAGEDHGQTMCFVIQGPDEEVVGGVIAATHWDWLYIDTEWLAMIDLRILVEVLWITCYMAYFLLRTEDPGLKHYAVACNKQVRDGLRWINAS
jgi:hypothetical protein